MLNDYKKLKPKCVKENIDFLIEGVLEEPIRVSLCPTTFSLTIYGRATQRLDFCNFGIDDAKALVEGFSYLKHRLTEHISAENLA